MTVRIKALDAEFGVAPQPLPSDMDDIRRAGYKSIVDARPDNEDAGQPTFDEIAVAADAVGLQTIHIPVRGAPSADDQAKFSRAWATLPKPVLGYCRSGSRAQMLWQLSKGKR